jgi:hypothetical protein
VVRHMPPAEESRKFDVHACEAGMNIKFPGIFLWTAKRPYTGKTVRGTYPKMRGLITRTLKEPFVKDCPSLT